MVNEIPDAGYVCRYDLDERILHVRYGSLVTPAITVAVYEWLGNSIGEMPEDHEVFGCIFDFREVSEFASQTLSSAKSTGTTFRAQHAERIQKIPVALIEKNTYQEMMVRTSMKLAKQETDDNPRVVVVWSDADARKFFTKWHAATNANQNT